VALERVSIEEASKIIDRPAETLHEWIKSGRIEAEEVDGCLLIPFDQLSDAAREDAGGEKDENAENIRDMLRELADQRKALTRYQRMETGLRERIEDVLRRNSELSALVVIQQERAANLERSGNYWKAATLLMSAAALGVTALYL